MLVCKIIFSLQYILYNVSFLTKKTINLYIKKLLDKKINKNKKFS